MDHVAVALPFAAGGKGEPLHGEVPAKGRPAGSIDDDSELRRHLAHVGDIDSPPPAALVRVQVLPPPKRPA